MTRAFWGFDIDAIESSGFFNSSSAGAPSGTWNIRFIPPIGMYHNKGVSTLDLTQIPPAGAFAPSQGFILYNEGRVAGGAYGHYNYTSHVYTGASGVTRASWNTSQGHQLALVRSMVGITNEVWINFDFRFPFFPTSSLTGLTFNSWSKLFIWGDVEIYCKQTTYAAATGHEVVFSIRNNGVEVTTLTIPRVTAVRTPGTTDVEYYYASLHVKLDSTTGLIEFAVSSIAQAASYTNQNTVQTTPLASAPYIYMSPPVFDTGSSVYVGIFDNVHFDDAAFTSGRINVASFIPATGVANVLNTDFVKWVSGSSTAGASTDLAAGLTNSSDTIAVRAVSQIAKAYIPKSIASGNVTGYMEELIGFEIMAKKIANRNSLLTRRLQAGIYDSVEGEIWGDGAKSIALNFDSSLTIPTVFGVPGFDQIFRRTGGTRLTKTELGSGSPGTGFALAIRTTSP